MAGAAEAITANMALFIVRIVSPALVLLAALSIIFARAPPTPEPSPITSVVVAKRVPRRASILLLLELAALTFVADGFLYVIQVIFNHEGRPWTGLIVNATVGVVGFAGLAALGAWKDIQGVPVWFYKRIKSALFLALVLDIVQVLLIAHEVRAGRRAPPHVPEEPVPPATAELLHLAFPALRVLVLLPLFAVICSPITEYTAVESEENGSEPHDTSLLLPPSSTGLSPVTHSQDPSKYGTFRNTRLTVPSSSPVTRSTTPAPSQSSDPKQDSSDIALDPTWGEIWRRIRRLSPYLWPSKSRWLQFISIVCIAIVLVGRFVNVLVPFALGEVVQIFDEGSARSPWPYLFAYVGLRFLQSGGGLPALREILWAPVMQYSDREMSQLSFDHILNLSFAWHTKRKTGEVLRILDRGAAVNHILEVILFNILPTFIDIGVALVIFVFKFDWLLAVVIFAVMFAYVFASVVITRWRTKIRRQMNERDTVTRGIHTDCLLNYETVKYFGGEQHEGERYGQALREYQTLEYKVILSLNLLNLTQNFIISVGLLIGSLIVAIRVTKGQSRKSDFVIFITYIAQLYGPLNQLGWIYRSVNQSLIDTERLLALLNEPTEVNDKPNAPDLVVEDGEIEFRNVSFSYDGRNTALNGISFKVPKGSSVALVGESGAGKSTILRLLYRFYDLRDGEGQILIDGQDISDVTQASLRKAIGVVPQDSVLFNSSIGYNIGYGKFGSTQEEIEAAAKSAQLHDRIMTFPDGYETKVGERGVRLSGGEKQRVAVARTLLKDPRVLLLDEATSALDTHTEKDIQKALQNLVQGRSSLAIAHRLSTIASADVILVLKNGEIAEQGSHKELLALDGIFASMWMAQITAEQAAVEPVNIGESSSKDEVVGYLVDDEPESKPEVEAQPSTFEEGSTSAAAEPTETTEEDNIEGSVEVAPEVAENVDEEPSSTAEIDAGVPKLGAAQLAPATTSDVASPASVAFPSSPVEDDEPAAAPAPQVPQPGVTFTNPEPTPGSPNPEGEGKRKMTQNFQRLARRISLGTRRTGSSSSIPIIASLLRDNSPRTSTDEGTSSRLTREESTVDSIASVATDTSKGNKKKEKKEKTRKTTL